MDVRPNPPGPRTVAPVVAAVLAALLGSGILVAALPAPTAQAAGRAGADVRVTASSAPVSARTAPYLALGWGDPPSPTTVMAATGVRTFTLAFMLSGRGCTPRWDGTRPLLGGTDASAIAAIRSAGGDVAVSFGGWSGRKLGTACHTVGALVAAYEEVVDAYGLDSVDIDIEHGEFTDARTRLRVVTALAALQSARPDLRITVTFGCTPTGPDADGRSLVTDAARLGFQPYAWTIMPFDFGLPESDMGATSIAAAEGMHAELMTIYGESSSAAYAHLGISTMDGATDEADETVSTADFEAMRAYATQVHLARLTFWMVNRDRPCPPGVAPGDTCSGIDQAEDAFTSLDAGFTG